MRVADISKMFLMLVGFSAVLAFADCSLALKSQERSTTPGTKDKPNESTLIGKWAGADAKLEFREDGSMTINGDEFNYSTVGNTIVIGAADEQLEFPFVLKGNTLTLAVGERASIYTRSDADESAATPRLSGGGERARELAGKWCYLSNFSSKDGGRMSSTCFTLSEDGTYEYYSETSSSNPYGGTGSQTNDSGRWTASSTALTVASNGGETRTYALEKRNHPKNGDPMLVVDGDAFVTAYKRQPW